MEKKQYAEPEIEMTEFETTDTITSSDGIDLPDDEWDD